MLNVGKRQNGVTLGRWPLRGPNGLRVHSRDIAIVCVHSRAAGSDGASGLWAHRDGAAPGVSERWATECSASSSLRSSEAAGTCVEAVMW